MRAVVLLLAIVLLAAVSTAVPTGYPQDSKALTPAPASQCRPGAQWQEDCNFCRCGKDGVSRVCTLAICASEKPTGTPQSGAKRVRGDRRGKKRSRGDTASTSSEKGTSRKNREGRRKKNRKPKGPCTPNETTEYECNQCRCAQDGSGFICTRRVCPPVVPERRRREMHCTPGESFPSADGCNMCVCTNDGRNAACTQKLCFNLPLPS